MSSTRTTEPAAGTREKVLIACALAAPGTLLVVATAVMLAAIAVGADPLWRVEPLTLPEAAGLRDNGEVMRMIESGADPNATGSVRAGFVDDNAQVVTPLEAAVGTRRADMVELLLDSGATMDASMFNRLVCFADVVKADDVRELLEARRPAGAPVVSCEAVPIPWR